MLSDFPSGAEGQEALRRLLYAARSTPSFPGAFEPATPRVVRGPARPEALTESEADRSERPGRVDLSGVSSETGAPDPGPEEAGWAELVDGGVLDNIPVSWAVRAIAASPASYPVDRWLLYLQPVPPAPVQSRLPSGKPDPSADRGVRRVTRLARLLKQTRTTKLQSESLLDDADELRAVAAASQARQAVARGLPGAVATPAGELAPRAALAVPEAGRARGGLSPCLLESPIDVIGPDPLPVPDQPCPLEALDDARGRSVDLLKGLRKSAADVDAPTDALALPDCLQRPEELPVYSRSPMAVARAVALLFDWVRAAEAAQSTCPDLAAPGIWETEVRQIRERLYEARFAVAVLLAVRDRLVLRCVAPGETRTPSRSCAKRPHG